ncbi:hypothetical protein SESBI_43931 [Sesbania bispinosa]|nr:hypothetical protein SESBI_43931 [Sesbania bispinosa]
MGSFVNEPRLHYEAREIHVFHGLEMDTWSYFEALGLAKDLGYVDKDKVKMWWKEKGAPFDQGLKPLAEDDDALELANELIVPKQKEKECVHLYSTVPKQKEKESAHVKEPVLNGVEGSCVLNDTASEQPECGGLDNGETVNVEQNEDVAEEKDSSDDDSVKDVHFNDSEEEKGPWVGYGSPIKNTKRRSGVNESGNAGGNVAIEPVVNEGGSDGGNVDAEPVVNEGGSAGSNYGHNNKSCTNSPINPPVEPEAEAEANADGTENGPAQSQQGTQNDNNSSARTKIIVTHYGKGKFVNGGTQVRDVGRTKGKDVGKTGTKIVRKPNANAGKSGAKAVGKPNAATGKSSARSPGKANGRKSTPVGSSQGECSNQGRGVQNKAPDADGEGSTDAAGTANSG